MKKVLIIEDNNEMRDNIAEILELARYEVYTGSNGKEGVKQAQAHKPDIIICDIMMPELDGYGVLHILAKDPDTASIPFIFLTAKAEKSEMRKGMNLGADDYLTKPFTETELLDAIEIRLKRHDLVKGSGTKVAEGLDQFIETARGQEELKKLSSDRKIKHYAKKTDIFQEDSYPHSLYLIVRGRVKTAKSNEMGKEYITGLHNEGDFIGYEALLQDQPYTETATALEDTEVAMIPKQDFYDLIYKNREVAAKFIKILSNDLASQEERLINLAYNSVRKRVADALLMLNNEYKKENEAQFSMAISREDLASIVGTATESVIRVLSDFKNENIIDIKGSKITIQDEEKLKKMKN